MAEQAACSHPQRILGVVVLLMNVLLPLLNLSTTLVQQLLRRDTCAREASLRITGTLPVSTCLFRAFSSSARM